jgi:Protein of unknown function (DUF1351)
MTEDTTTQDAATEEATYTGIVVEYSPVDAALAELRARYANVVFPVDTKDGMKDAKEVRQKLVKLRTGLEAKRKEIKEPALRRAQAIDAEAKMITTAIKAIEDPIDAQIKAEEQRIEAEKAAKAAKLAEIREKIDGIRALPLVLAGACSEDIAAEKEALESFTPLEEVFGELVEDCKAAMAEAIASLTDLHARVMAQEAAAALVEAERQRLAEAERAAAAALAAEREALAAERAAYEAEKAAFEAQRAALAAAQAGAETEPVAFIVEPDPTMEDELRGNGQAAPQGIALIQGEIGSVDAGINIVAEPVAATAWRIRQAAIHTAAQFQALAGKVEQCGFGAFADELRVVANGLRSGAHDAALAKADHDALIAADTLLLDATVECIDCLSSQDIAA